MGSRLRDKPEKLFEVFAEVARPQEDGQGPFIIQKYPPDYNEQDVLNNIPKFAFPCENNTTQVDQFAFVLTDLESRFRFGYCRHGSGAQTCLCVVSHLPWYEVFYKMLNFLAEIINRTDDQSLMPFLESAYEQSMPYPDEPVTIVAAQDMFNFTAPDLSSLPSIPASRNLTEYYNAVDTSNMMRIFASMLQERRIIITSKKLSRLTACIHAAEALLYPMHWQHLYIPVLPAHLLDYVTAPMPYLIGVHSSLMEKVDRNRMEIGDAVIVDADNNEVRTEHEDLEALPEEVSSYLKKHLKTQRLQNSMVDSGDAISRAFLQAHVRLIGGYRDALKFRIDEPITFERDAFVQSRSSQSMQAFLENMLQLQIFQQFINGRLELLNGGEGFDDLFERESLKYADSLNTQSKYKEWLSKQKRKLKEGGKDIISDMREKVKMQSKKVMSKVREMNENKMSSRKVTGGIVHSRSSGADRPRPSTIVGSQLSSSRPPRPPPPAVSSTSHRPRTVVMPGQKTQSSLTVEEEHGSHDDSHLRLSYHSIDVSLMTDTDIQNAMLRSASAETLDQKGHTGSQSTSDGDMSSTPSSEALSPSDENLTNIPYVDMASTSHQVTPFSPASSSEEDLTRPPPLPSKDSKPVDRLITTDRLISSKAPGPMPKAPPRAARRIAESRSSGSSPQQSPQLVRPPPVAPRKTSVGKMGEMAKEPSPLVIPPKQGHQQPEKPLIHFESSESDADGVDQFDPLALSGKDPSVRSPVVANDNTVSEGAFPGLSRNRSSRHSLTRTAAFRRAPVDSPLRCGYRDDHSPDKEMGAKDALTDLFDPLVTSSTTPVPSAARTTQQVDTNNHAASVSLTASPAVVGESGSLMQDWTLHHLAGGGGSGFSSIPSGATLTCPISAGTRAVSAARPASPMASSARNPLYASQAASSQPMQRRSAMPQWPPAGAAMPQANSNPSYQPLKPAAVTKSDPFQGLISLDLGTSSQAFSGSTTNPTSMWQSGATVAKSQTQRPGDGSSLGLVPSAQSSLPQAKPPPKSKWETFD